MRCRECGTEIADKALVCYKCGAATTEPTFKPPAAKANASWLALFVSALALALLVILAIYLGRVQRVNSWDVVHRPGRLWELARIRIDDPFGNLHLIGYVILFGGFLTLAYAGLYGLSALVGSQRNWPSR